MTNAISEEKIRNIVKNEIESALGEFLIAWGSIPRSSAAINKGEKRSKKNIKNFTISKLACFRGK